MEPRLPLRLLPSSRRRVLDTHHLSSRLAAARSRSLHIPTAQTSPPPPTPATATATATTEFASRTQPRAPHNAPETPRGAVPRWKASPAGLHLPFRIRSAEGKSAWRCNEDPRLLDAMYARLLGGVGGAGGGAAGPGGVARGAALLRDETKWLAVTHKTFDQGKRGFNERLAFYGRRLAEMTALRMIAERPAGPQTTAGAEGIPSGDRTPVIHPDLVNVVSDNLNGVDRLLRTSRIHALAMRYGIVEVMRWKPQDANNLKSSGLESVSASCVYAIVGALALEQGAPAAERLLKDKILRQS